MPINENAFSPVLYSFNKQKIKYALLRTKDNFFDELELDILVWPQFEKQIHYILENHQFTCWKNKKFLKKKVYAKYDGLKLWLIDVHFAFIQNGIIYLNLDLINNRLRKDKNGFNILSPEDQLLHYFFHNLLGKGHLAKKHFVEIQKIPLIKLDKMYIQKQINDIDIQNVFEQFITNPETFTKTDYNLSKKISTIKKRLIKKSKINALRHWFWRKGAKYIYRKKGIHIAFLGVDGAGKSSVIFALETILKNLKGLKYHVVYMGPWGNSQSIWHKWVLKKQFTLPSDEEIMTSSPTIKIRKYIKGGIYYISIYFELWYRWFKNIFPALRRGRIVISDRYIYDIRYIYKKREVKKFRLLRRILSHCFPKPHKIIFLYNDAKIIHNRKSQLTEEQINSFQNFYLKTINKYDYLSIKTDQDPIDIGKIILQEILHLYLKCNK